MTQQKSWAWSPWQYALVKVTGNQDAAQRRLRSELQAKSEPHCGLCGADFMTCKCQCWLSTAWVLKLSHDDISACRILKLWACTQLYLSMGHVEWTSFNNKLSLSGTPAEASTF